MRVTGSRLARPWTVAVACASLAAVQLLLASGAIPNRATQFGITPLGLGVENGNPAIVAALLQRGADARAETGGQTALHIAARTGSADIVRLLLDAGAAVDARETWQSATPLMVAASGRHARVI